MTTAEPRWKNRGPRHMAEMFPDDQERLNTLVAELNATRPGKHRQKDAIRYLLDFREDTISEMEHQRAHAEQAAHFDADEVTAP